MLEHIYQAWDAGHVRRWHSNTDMDHVTDYIATHSARMAVLLLRLWPNCRKELLATVITHDLGERNVGDLPYDLKKSDFDLSEHTKLEEQARNKLCGVSYELTAGEHKMLKLLDRIDSHLYVLKHRPKLAARIDWQDQLKKDYEAADDLGVEVEFDRLVRFAERKADV